MFADSMHALSIRSAQLEAFFDDQVDALSTRDIVSIRDVVSLRELEIVEAADHVPDTVFDPRMLRVSLGAEEGDDLEIDIPVYWDV